MQRFSIKLSIVALAIFLAPFALAACGESSTTGEERDQQARQDAFEGLQTEQPAETMTYSPTRENVNFWIETWDEPGKIAYVYLTAANGQISGYYIFEGPPTNDCASLTQPTDVEDYGSAVATKPAVSMDGVYYSGGQCARYYGKDASTGSYIEFTVGGGQDFRLYEQPLPRPDVEPLGFTTVKDVEK